MCVYTYIYIYICIYTYAHRHKQYIHIYVYTHASIIYAYIYTHIERRQHSGIRQGCPLSPYLFIIFMTVIMKDINSKLTHEERHVLSNEEPLGMEGPDKLLYADDAIILASSKQATEIILHKIQEESNIYNMRLNTNKCILLGMNSLGRVQYLDGGYMPMADRAPYLGKNMSAKGNPHFEISTRIISTTATLNKLDLFWEKYRLPGN